MDQPLPSLYSNTTLNDVQLAAVYYPILVELARRKKCITYGDLVAEAKQAHPETDYIQNAIAVSTGRKLDVVRQFTSSRELPDVTSLVISRSTGESGTGQTDFFDPVALREEVFTYDWSAVSEDFDLYIETAERQTNPPPQLTRKDAMALTLDYYQANRNALPAATTKHRDDIIELILAEHDVEEAFELIRRSL